jgi:hypothetical protein
MVRNNYLFGLDEGSSDLLEEYSIDLKACWHSKELETEVTNLPMKVSFHTVEALQSLQHIQRAQKNAPLTENTRKVLVLEHSHKLEHVDSLLDAGMCIATHNAQVNKNKQSYLRSFTSPDSSNTDTTTTIHTLHANTPHTTTTTIDTTHYTTRCLPSFIIAGAMKCGTGELMKWLQLHPSLRVGSNDDKRELHYFTSISNGGGSGSSGDNGVYHNHTHARRLLQAKTITNTAANTHSTNNTHPSHAHSTTKPSKLAEYAQFFPTFGPTELEGLLTFEKSPDYIRDPTALKLIRSYMLNMKIIVLLRNPVMRALSEFSHHCRHGRYVKLVQDVVVSSSGGSGGGSGSGSGGRDGSSTGTSTGSVVYKSGNVLRIDTHSSFASFPKASYEVLTYPCSAADAELYFSSAGNGYNSGYGSNFNGTTSYSTASKTTNLSTNTDANVNANTNTNSTTSTTTDITHTTHNRAHHVPEIEHGLYYHQLAALYEM